MRLVVPVLAVLCSVLDGVAACKERAPAAEAASDAAPMTEPTSIASPSPSPSPSGPTPAPLASSSAECKPKLDAIRAIQFAPQPCKKWEDCTVWPNGRHLHRCPNEINVTNAAKIEALWGAYEASGCAVEATVRCQARQLRGCVNNECGGS